MRTKISVTREHIKRFKNKLACVMLEHVIGSFVKEKVFVYVSENSLVVGTYKYFTPKRLIAFIEKYDDCQPVKPFSFYLNIPKRFLK